MTEYFENYTFYTCLVNSDPEQYSALPIGCPSNSTNATVATCDHKHLNFLGAKVLVVQSTPSCTVVSTSYMKFIVIFY